MIKEIAKKAGFTDTGRVLNQPNKKLYELISSHTARRTFCTGMFLQGVPVIDIMKISGHRSQVNFLKYVKVSKLETAKRLQIHMSKNLSQYSLKAVG